MQDGYRGLGRDCTWSQQGLRSGKIGWAAREALGALLQIVLVLRAERNARCFTYNTLTS